MPNKPVTSSPTSAATTSIAVAARATTSCTIDPLVLQDLAAAVLEESDYHDTYLIASDGVHVAACRFILAARSSVLKKMLYGNFREAKSSTICMVGYDSRTLQAVVDYCCTNTLNLLKNNDNNDKSSNSANISNNMVEQLVQVYNAADFLDLKGLATLAEREIRKTMSACPSLACLVLNLAATMDSPISQYALQMIEVRPYVALDTSSSTSGTVTCTGGGIECLQPEWLLYIMKSQSIAAGEFFLFFMLNRWYEHHIKISKASNHKQKASSAAAAASSSAPSTAAAAAAAASASGSYSPLDVAYQCAKYIQFDNIEPQILLDDALQKKCPWMSPTWIFDAIAKQALRASQDRIWSVQCRGGGGGGASSISASCNKSRILVEGAGNPNANGIYYLSISGLTRGGDLYSKREIAVGQEYVYTLSCRLAPNDNNNKNDSNISATSSLVGNTSIVDASSSATSTTSAMVECRIFCSKLLSHAAISTLHDIQQFNRIRGHLDPVFQPILQILSVEAPASPSSTTATSTNHHHSTPLHDTFYRVQVSDGDWTMKATLAPTPHLRELLQRGDLVENSIIQVLDFGLYLTDNDNSGSNNNMSCCCLHIQRVSIVNANPGQEFGTPKPFVYQGTNNTNNNNDEITTTGSGNNSVATGSYGDSVGTGGIQNLYTCTYPLDRQAKDTKIPRTGWLVAEHGQGPSPTCTWIPGVVRRDTVISAPAVAPVINSSNSNSSNSSGASVATAPTSNIADDSNSLASIGLSTRR